MEEKYDIFLSYRRNDKDGHSNVDTARAICYEFRAHGFKVFFDFEKCTDGYFSTRILPAIRTCKFFVLVLTKDALSRCVNEKDWVRREIEEAISYERKIIPVSPDGEFPGWPSDLPKSLTPLMANEGGLQVSTIHRDASFKSDIKLLIDQRMGGSSRTVGIKKYSVGIGSGLIIAALLTFFVMNGKNKESEEGMLDSVVLDSTLVESSQKEDFGIDSKTLEKEEKQNNSVQLNKKKDAEKKKVTVSEKDSDAKKSSNTEELATTLISYDSNVKVKEENINVKVKEENIVDKETKTSPSPMPITSNSDYKKARDLFNSGNYKQALKLFESIKGSGVSEPNLDWYIEACKKKI